MALRNRKRVKPKLAADPKVQAVIADVEKRTGMTVSKAVKDTATLTPEGSIKVKLAPDHSVLGAVFEKARKSPSKTQVCDAIREGQPGLPFAAVDRICSAIMKLYGRD